MSGPNLLIFIGGLMAVFGAFWAAAQQTAYEKEVRQKMEETIFTITGGDSFAYLMPQLFGTEQYAIPSLVHSGSYTLYDVSARIVNVSVPPPYSTTNLEFGNIAKDSASLNADVHLPLPSANGKQSYNIFISARNGFFTELLRMRVVDNVWKRAVKLTRMPDGKELYRLVDEGFPVDAQGETDWSE